MGGAELSGLQLGISLRRCGNLLSCGSRFVMSGAFIFFSLLLGRGEKGTVRFPAGGGGGKGKRVEKGAVVEDWEGLLTWVVFLKKRRTFLTGRAAGETSVQLGIAGIGKTGGLFFSFSLASLGPKLMFPTLKPTQLSSPAHPWPFAVSVCKYVCTEEPARGAAHSMSSVPLPADPSGCRNGCASASSHLTCIFSFRGPAVAGRTRAGAGNHGDVSGEDNRGRRRAGTSAVKGETAGDWGGPKHGRREYEVGAGTRGAPSSPVHRNTDEARHIGAPAIAAAGGHGWPELPRRAG